MNKQNRILAAILALQVVLSLVVFWPEKSVARGQPLFGDLSVDQIVRFSVGDTTGAKIQIANGPEGWALPDMDDYPVLEDKVRALLEKIVGVQTDRLVTRTGDSHKRLRVTDDDYERLVEFELADGSQHKLYLGTSPSYQVMHVRADDQAEVYLALGLSTADAATAVTAWVDTSYFSVTQDQIVAITLDNQNGHFEFSKDAADVWTMVNLPAGETLLPNNVASLATRVSSLRMMSPLGKQEQPSYSMEDPAATVTIVTRDDQGNEKTYVVRVGALLEDEKGYVVKSATSPYYVLIADYTVGDLTERTLQDFIQVPTTPTPPSEGQPTPAP